jgi:hypothetical protein
MPVSSTTQARIGARTSILGNTKLRTATSNKASSHGAFHKMMQRLMLGANRVGPRRAAIGSMLLRSPGNSKPLQYDASGP